MRTYVQEVGDAEVDPAHNVRPEAHAYEVVDERGFGQLGEDEDDAGGGPDVDGLDVRDARRDGADGGGDREHGEQRDAAECHADLRQLHGDVEGHPRDEHGQAGREVRLDQVELDAPVQQESGVDAAEAACSTGGERAAVHAVGTAGQRLILTEHQATRAAPLTRRQSGSAWFQLPVFAVTPQIYAEKKTVERYLWSG